MSLEDLDKLVRVDYEKEPDSHSISSIMERFFPNTEGNQNRLLTNLYGIAKHIAQNGKEPQWFDFNARKEHDLDLIAQESIARDLRMSEIEELLTNEYSRKDRFWQVFYKNLSNFRVYFDACVRRVKQLGTEPPNPPNGEGIEPSKIEVDESVKQQVKERDRFQCQCCGIDKGLQVDHIKSRFHGGTHDLENLQLLCRACNQEKGIEEINFRKHQSPFSKPSNRFPNKLLTVQNVYSMTQWERCLRKSINFFYQAAVVKGIRRVDDFGHPTEIGKRWEIYLHTDNDPKWIQPHLQGIAAKIRRETYGVGIQQPTRIVITNGKVTVRSEGSP